MGRRRHKHRSWRERKECFGQMVQLDGSQHDWFERRRDHPVLMVMVDEATNRTLARFFEEETTHASYNVLEAWVGQYGLGTCTWIETVFTAASGWRRWKNKWLEKSLRRNWGGPWSN